MTIPIKIVCASLSFQRLDESALKALSDARLNNDIKIISKFKKDVGFPIEQLSIIDKCNAVIIVFCYSGNFSSEFVRSRIFDSWEKLSPGGIINSLRNIKLFEDIDAIRYLGECAIGLHSVTLGDSQVFSQIFDSLQEASLTQPENPTFATLASWLKTLALEVRSKTNIFSGNTSLERIATEIISKNVEEDKKVSLIGFGKSGKLIAKILKEELGYPLVIANKTQDVLAEIAKEKKVEIVNLDSYEKLLDCACVVLAITSNEKTRKYSSALLSELKKLNSKPKLIIDICSPSLLNKEQGINLITLEDLSIEANNNINKRASEANKARDIVNKSCVIAVESLNREIGKITYTKQINENNHKLNKKKLDVLKIRNDGYRIIRKYLEKYGFIEVTTPYIVGVSTDPPKVDKGGTIDVFWHGGTRAFLRQSNQLYKQMIVASGLPKIYEIGPFWRAEAIKSYRHLQESIGLDIEMSNPKSLEKLYELAYSIILQVKTHLWDIYHIKNNKFVLPKFNMVPVITYDEAINILNSKGYSITFGEDLGLAGEGKLGQIIKKERKSDVFIVKNYPDSIKKFYTKKTQGGATETFDIIVSGWELVSGAIRENNRTTIEKSMHLSGIDARDYGFYLSVIDGSVPHGGFCLGIDRLIAKILDLEMVSDAVAFPRTFEKLIP